MKTRNQKGQIAIFFAVGFVFFLVLFLLVVNSSILTAQKMKIQHTADISAIAASAYLVNVANRANSLNRAIEDLYKFTQIQLLNPVGYHCVINPAINCTLTGCTCAVTCSGKDAIWKKFWLGFYTGWRTILAMKVRAQFEDGYKEAYKLVQDVALSKENLPADILHYYKEHGGYPGIEALKKSYEAKTIKFKGNFASLKDIYYIPEPKTADGDWLPLYREDIGESIDESRLFITPKWVYNFCNVVSLFCNDPTPCLRSPIPIPIPVPTSVKVLKVGSKEVFYFSAISYQPLNALNLFRIPFKQPDNFVFAQKKRKYLFSESQTLTAIALAKPADGKLATDQIPNTISNLINPFKVLEDMYKNALADMRDYSGPVLVPIADESQIGIDLNQGAFKDPVLKEWVWH
jgi:hypothetical protein